jgi:hypothetical protein
MSKTVVLPDQREIEFPDNATTAEMNRAIGRLMSASKRVVAEEVVEKPVATGKFFQSVGRGIDQVQGLFGSGLDVVGEATGIESLEKYGEKVYERNAAQLAEREARSPRLALKDVDNIVVGQQSWVDFIQQSLGEVAPSLGVSLAGAGAGAKAGAAVGNVLTGPFVPLKLVGVPVGALVGGAIGAFLPSALLGAGEVQQTIKELDPEAESPWAALGGGAVIGALDVASLAVPVLATMAKGVPKSTIVKGLMANGVSESIARGAVGTAAKAVGQAAIKRFPKGRLGKAIAVGVPSAASEGLTERLQELTSIEIAEAVTDKEVMNRAERLLEATVVGTIAGSTLGGAAGAVTGKKYDIQNPPPPLVTRGAYDEIILSTSAFDPNATEGIYDPLNPEKAIPSNIIEAEENNRVPNDPEIEKVLEEAFNPTEEEVVAPLQEPVVETIEDINKIVQYIWKNDLAYDAVKDETVFTYNGKTYKIKEVKLKNKQKVIEISEDGIVIPELRSKPYTKPIKYWDSEVKKQIKNVIENKKKLIEDPLRTITTAEITRISEGDQKAIISVVEKKPVEVMKAVVTGDFNYDIENNKPQTFKSFADRIGYGNPKDRETATNIFESLVKKGSLEKVGKNRWKYTDKSLNNKDIKAVVTQDLKAVSVGIPTEKGNKTEWVAKTGGKDFSIIKEVKNKKQEGKPVKSKLVFSNISDKGVFPEYVAKNSYQGFDYKIEPALYDGFNQDMTEVEANTRKVKGKPDPNNRFQSREPFRNILYVKESNSDQEYSRVSPIEYENEHSKNEIRNWVVKQHSDKKDIYAVNPDNGLTRAVPVSQARDVGPQENIQTSRWTVRGKGNRNRIKNVRNDKQFSIQPKTDEQQLSSIKEEIINFTDREFVGARTQDKFNELGFPTGLLLSEQFKVATNNEGIVDRNGKLYSSPVEMRRDLTIYDKQIAELKDDIVLKLRKKNSFKDVGVLNLLDQDIVELQERIVTTQESIDQILYFLKGNDPKNSIGRPPSRAEVRKLMSPKEKAIVDKDEKMIVDNVKIAYEESGKKVADKQAELIKKSFTNEAEARTAKEASETGLAIINLYSRFVSSMQNHASKYPVFLPFHEAARKYSELMRGITNRVTTIASPYNSLNLQQRRNVDKLLMAAKVAGVKPTPVNTREGKGQKIVIPKYYSFSPSDKITYGAVRDDKGKILTGKEEIEARIAEAPETYTRDYFQYALNLSLGGKSRNDLMYKFEVGDTITILDPVESRATDSMYQALDLIWLTFTKATVNASGRVVVGGINDRNLYQTLEKEVEVNRKENAKNNGADVNKEPLPISIGGVLSRRASQLNPDVDKELKNHYEEIAATVQNLEASKREGYFPSVREGDGFVRIYSVEVDPVTKKETEAATHNRIEITVPFWEKKLFNGDFEKSGKKYMNKYFPTWREDYKDISEQSGTNVELRIEYINKNVLKDDIGGAADVNLESIERLLLEQDRLINKTLDVTTGKDDAERKVYEARLVQSFKAFNNNLRNRSFRSHTNTSRGIPGFVTPQTMDTYISESFGLYTVKAARLVARLETEDDINGALRELKKQEGATGQKPTIGGQSLYTVAKKNAEFLFAPQSAAAFFKTVAFNGFLGGNISSLMVNLSQNLITVSFLYGAYGAKGRGTVAKAFVDSSRMLTDIIFIQSEFIIPPLPEKGVPRKDWTASEEAGYQLYSKWKNILKGEYEYRALAQMSQDGTFGKMNTEAIANNSDVTSKFIEQRALGDLLSPEATATVTRRLGGLSRFLTSMYAGGEMVNRMTAALATIRLVKQHGSGELRTFVSGIPGQDRLNGVEEGPAGNPTQEEMVAAATTVSNATQFNLDPYNRAPLARLFGGLPLQFLGFVTMMIELYSNVIFSRYGDQELSFMNNRQKQRMLVTIVGQQLVLGGLFALPFADDLDDIVGLLAKKTGLPELSIYETIYESLIDDMGMSNRQATALLRGPLEGYTPISVGKRIALSPFQNVLNMKMDNIFQVPFKLIGGPSASFIEGYTQRIAQAAREGRWDKVVAYLPPTALTTNLAKAFYNSNEAILTGSGRELDDGLEGMDRLWAAVGFTTTTVAREREFGRRNVYNRGRMRPIRDRYTDRITKLTLEMIRTDNANKKQALANRISEYYNEIIEHDAGKEPEDKIDPSFSIGSSVGTRIRQALSPEPGAISPVPKALRARVNFLNKGTP